MRVKNGELKYGAPQCQVAPLSLTMLSLRGMIWACQVESPKNAGFLARVEYDQQDQKVLSNPACMLLLCLLKGSHLITLSMGPHRKDDSDPHISKRSYGD